MPNRIIHVAEMADVTDAVYIGRSMSRQSLRGSPLANPYKIGPDGTRAEVLAKYREWLLERFAAGDRKVIKALIECRDRPLACWCRRSHQDWTPETFCHGDIIDGFQTLYTDDELRAFAAPATRDQEGMG